MIPAEIERMVARSPADEGEIELILVFPRTQDVRSRQICIGSQPPGIRRRRRFEERRVGAGAPQLAGAAFIDVSAIADFCRRNYIRKHSLFGSALRGELRAESDIDLLVEFEPGHIPELFRLVGMEEELSTIVGRKADLRTAAELSRHFLDEVLRQAKPLYATE